MDEETKTIKSANGTDMEPVGIQIAVEKFRRPSKHYSLIWVRGRIAWLCEEDKTEYRTSSAALEAAGLLAKEYDVRLQKNVR
jgi:hypothetical protein